MPMICPECRGEAPFAIRGGKCFCLRCGFWFNDYEPLRRELMRERSLLIQNIWRWNLNTEVVIINGVGVLALKYKGEVYYGRERGYLVVKGELSDGTEVLFVPFIRRDALIENSGLKIFLGDVKPNLIIDTKLKRKLDEMNRAYLFVSR